MFWVGVVYGTGVVATNFCMGFVSEGPPDTNTALQKTFISLIWPIWMFSIFIQAVGYTVKEQTGE